MNFARIIKLATWWSRFSWPWSESGEIKLDALPLDGNRVFSRRFSSNGGVSRMIDDHWRWRPRRLKVFALSCNHVYVATPRSALNKSLGRNKDFDILLSEIESYDRALLILHTISLFFLALCLQYFWSPSGAIKSAAFIFFSNFGSFWLMVILFFHFYRAMLRRARLCHSMSSVFPSVRDVQVSWHIGWNTSKIISRLISLRFMLTPT